MMKVCNQLDTYTFHDCEICHATMKDGELILELSHVDVLKDNPCNPHGVAMMSSEAKMVMEGAHILKAKKDFFTLINEPSRNEPVSTQDCQMIMDMIEGQTIFGLEQEDRLMVVEVTTYNNFNVTLYVAYDDVVIQWDRFVDKAWFEKWKEKGINGTGHDES